MMPTIEDLPTGRLEHQRFKGPNARCQPFEGVIHGAPHKSCGELPALFVSNPSHHCSASARTLIIEDEVQIEQGKHVRRLVF